MNTFITVPASSIGLTVYRFPCTDILETRKILTRSEESFFTPPTSEPEKTAPGFIKGTLEDDAEYMKGRFACVIAFEVESLQEETGIVDTEIKYRIDTCEMFARQGFLFAWGKPAAQKKMVEQMTGLLGIPIKKMEIDPSTLKAFHDGMGEVTMVTVKNPSTRGADGKEERGAKLVKLGGRIEDYAEFDVVEDGHTLEAVTGVCGEVGEEERSFVTSAKRKGGSLKLGVRGAKGFEITYHEITEIFGRILGVSLLREEELTKTVKKMKADGTEIIVSSPGIVITSPKRGAKTEAEKAKEIPENPDLSDDFMK